MYFLLTISRVANFVTRFVLKTTNLSFSLPELSKIVKYFVFLAILGSFSAELANEVW